MRPQHLSGRGRSVRGLATVVLLATLASCSSSAGEPQRSSAPDLSPSPVKKVDKDKAAIAATLTAYKQITKASLTRGRKLPPMQRIRAVVAEPYATRLGRQLATERSSGLVMRGADIYTPRSITVSGSRATLVTCWDGTRADVVNVSAKPAQKVRPTKPNVTTFLLKRAANGWKITKRTPGSAC